jgi:hypothetical protein
MTKYKLSDLASTLGVLVLGTGIGAYFSQQLEPFALHLIIAGLVTHSVGMAIKHRIERTIHTAGEKIPGWVDIVYWACWLLIIAFIAYLAWNKQS